MGQGCEQLTTMTIASQQAIRAMTTVATRIILLFFASLHDNLFVFSFPFILLLFKFISVT